MRLDSATNVARRSRPPAPRPHPDPCPRLWAKAATGYNACSVKAHARSCTRRATRASVVMSPSRSSRPTASTTRAGGASIARRSAMARLGDHPNIVTVFDVGDENDEPYIVSELMPGGSVADTIARADDHRLPIVDALRIGEEIALALEHAHGAASCTATSNPRTYGSRPTARRDSATSVSRSKQTDHGSRPKAWSSVPLRTSRPNRPSGARPTRAATCTRSVRRSTRCSPVARPSSATTRSR